MSLSKQPFVVACISSLFLATLYVFETEEPSLQVVGFDQAASQIWGLRSFDSSIQKNAYYLFVISFFVFFGFQSLAIKHKSNSTGSQDLTRTDFFRRHLPLISAVLFFVPMVAVSNTDGTWVGYGGVAALRQMTKCLIAFLVFTVLVRKIELKKTHFYALSILCLIYVLSPIISKHITLPNMGALIGSDMHIECVIGASEKINKQLGLNAYDQIHPGYGVLVPSIIRLIEGHSGWLDLAGHVTILQLFQFIGLIIWMVIYHSWIPNSRLLKCTGLLLLQAWFRLDSNSLLYPVTTANRYLGLSIAVLVTATFRNETSSKLAKVLGLCVGLVMFNSPEHTPVVVLANIIYISFRIEEITITNTLNTLTKYLVYALFSSVICIMIYWMAFGIIPENIHYLFSALATGLKHGVGNLPLYYDPLAVLVTLLSIHHLAWGFYRIVVLKKRVSTAASFQASISAMCAIWMLYFINAPSESRLLFQLACLPLILPRAFWKSVRSIQGPRLEAGLLTKMRPFFFGAMTLTPLLYSANKNLWRESEWFTNDKPTKDDNCGLYLGTYLPEQAIKLVELQKASIELHEGKRHLVISPLPFITRLACKEASNYAWITNPFIDWQNKKAFEGFMRHLNDFSPDFIVVVREFDVLGDSWRQLCEYFELGISNQYVLVTEKNNMRIYKNATTNID